MTGVLIAADKDGQSLKKPQSVLFGPHKPTEVKYHYIGRLWNRVTNYGKAADDAYDNRTPACDWPNSPAEYPYEEGDFPTQGRSGNSYLYRGSLWLTAKVDGVPHVTTVENSEYQPIDEIHVNCPGDRAFFETSTKYYDVNVPGAGGHFPLGVEVTERTYSWPESYRYDFIIYEYTIKNVGIDTDNDGYPDTPRDLEEFYFTYRLDGDVSKLPEWDAEMEYSNQDDLAGINSSWNFLEKFPGWSEVDHGLNDENADTTLMFMFDADNPDYPSEYIDPATGELVEDDLGNPGVDGKLQTPGFLGFKILKTQPASFKVSKFRTGHIYNDPVSDQEAYQRMVAPSPGEDPFEEQGPSGVVVDPGGNVFPLDYRGFLTIGPIDNFNAGDSVVVTAALGVGADPDSGRIYSLMRLVTYMEIAQRIVDEDYQWNLPVPPKPAMQVIPYEESETDKGMAIIWDNASEDVEYDSVAQTKFLGYALLKAVEQTDQGWQYDTLETYLQDENGNWINEPPASTLEPGLYEFRDSDIVNGFIYSYAVEGLGSTVIPDLEVVSAGAVSRQVSPSNIVGTNLDDIKVVPNPYIGSAEWNNPTPSDVSQWEHKLQFINLPADAKIKIFTLDGDFVDEVFASQNVSGTYSGASVAEWDLITRNNQEAAPGIYLYVVQSPSLGEKIGKFVIVR
jgi:hypothetical protein